MKKLLISAAVLIVIIVVIELSLSFFATRYVNQTLDDTEGLTGHVEEVEVSLFTSSYTMRDLEIKQENSDHDLPLISVVELEVSPDWSEIFRGTLTTDLRVLQAQLNVYDRKNEEDVKNDAILEPKTWIGLTDNLVAFSVNELVIDRSVMRFLASNEEEKLSASAAITDINMLAQNIHNDKENQVQGSFLLTANVNNDATLRVEGSFDPNTELPTFDINAKLESLPASQFEDWFDLYLPIDIEAGNVDAAFEIKAEKAKVEGYFETGITNLDVFDFKEDVAEDVFEEGAFPLTPLFDAIIGGITTLFENHSEDQFALKVPFSGDLSDPEVSYSSALVSMIENAFVEALDIEIDNSIGREVKNDFIDEEGE